jgi:UDP-3-O-[3-hydroxymyristoyl] glucosamine N-acyltransferase
VGSRVILHPGVVIGADGFGYDSGPQGHKKIPQLGIVEIQDDVEIGANSTVDRARFDRTIIGQGTKIDNLVQVGHNCVVGRHCIICSQVGVSGSCVIGDGVILAGQVGLADHLNIGDGAIALAKSGLHQDVPPKGKVFGAVARPAGEEMKIEACKARLPELFTRVKQIEKLLGEGEGKKG